MNQYQRAKLNKILIIIAIVLGVIAFIVGIYFFIVSGAPKTEEVSYEDTIIAQGFFDTINIDLNTKTVQKDGKEITLQEEFGVPNEQAEEILRSTENVKKFFEDSTFELSVERNNVTITDPYQTKTLIVEADQINDDFDATDEPIQIKEGLYILKYDTEKRTKAAMEYIKTDSEAKSIMPDQIMRIEIINDESQTVYSKAESAENVISYGASAMGLNEYKKMIEENGNPSNITIATIGYGAAIDNTYFNGKIVDEFDYTKNNKKVQETIPQGSRILEVIKESTTNNIKIMPLVVVDERKLATTSNILQALYKAIEKSDVICYEFTHEPNEMIKQALKEAFDKNVPVCCVTKNNESETQMFPANDDTTIAVSSVDKSLKTTSYSAKGDFIDFVASSTDVKEIFNSSSSVSKWSGAQYSNAHIASAIALIKTYHKDYKISEIYDFLKNYSEDLGEKGKDSTFGNGFPNFSKIKISDVDKTYPELSDIAINNNDWEKSKKIQIKASDNIKLFGWNITTANEIPKDWKKSENVQNSLNVSEEVNENGKYYVWVVDTAGNVLNKTFEVNKIDKKPPTINYTIDESTLETEKYVSIVASATDEESGLHEIPYSWDNINWGTENTMNKVTKNGTYTLYVRDKLENISEQKITIKNLPQEGKAEIDEGTIIKSIKVSDKWEGNINKEVTIILNDNLNIKRRKITDADIMPEEFRPSQGEPEIEIYENGNTTRSNNENTTSQSGNTTGQSEQTTSQNNETTVQNDNFESENLITVLQNIRAPSQNSTIVEVVNTIQEIPTSNIEDSGMQGRTNVSITVSLEIGKKYYIWIESMDGNVTSQGFTIRKAE